MATPLNQPPSKPTNYLPWILGGCAILLFLGLIVVGVAGVVLYTMTPSDGSGRRIGLSTEKVKPVDAHGVETVKKTWSSCSAFAPADWTIVGNEQRVGIGTDLAAPDQSMSSSYGISALQNTQMYGTDFYGTATPEAALKTMMEAAGASNFSLENDSQMVGSYTLKFWRANMRARSVRGFALYQTFDTGDPSNYIMAYRIGSTDADKWDQYQNLVYDVAASIRCTKHLFPAQESKSREPKGSSKDDIEREMSRKRQEATMGFQNVYSPSTGQHWEASYSDYNATGPDGPGYYRHVGNSYEKLNEGFPPN
jgi:hypothetical protein